MRLSQRTCQSGCGASLPVQLHVPKWKFLSVVMFVERHNPEIPVASFFVFLVDSNNTNLAELYCFEPTKGTMLCIILQRRYSLAHH